MPPVVVLEDSMDLACLGGSFVGEDYCRRRRGAVTEDEWVLVQAAFVWRRQDLGRVDVWRKM
jgi:hypothetical protein